MFDKRTKHLLTGAKRGFELLDNREPAEALKVFREVIVEARKAGIESANLYWGCAVASDYTGEMEMAFENVTAALALDPCRVPSTTPSRSSPAASARRWPRRSAPSTTPPRPASTRSWSGRARPRSSRTPPWRATTSPRATSPRPRPSPTLRPLGVIRFRRQFDYAACLDRAAFSNSAGLT